MDITKRKPRSVTLQFEDQELEVTLSPSVKYGDIKRMLSDSSDDYLRAENFILKCVLDWNLNIDGEKVPITSEGLDAVDSDVVIAIVEKISENPTMNLQPKP